MQTDVNNSVIEIKDFPVGMLRLGFDGRNLSVLSANEYYYGLFDMTEVEYSMTKPDEYGLRIATFASEFSEGVDRCKENPEHTIPFYFSARRINDEPVFIGVTAKLAEIDGENYIFNACAQGIDWIVNRLSNYDRLTGLPKLHLFNSVAIDYMQNAVNDDCFAVISADLNNFKLINERIGIENGDKVLISLGTELDVLVKDRGCCCRVFSDKYLVFIKYHAAENLKAEIEKFINGFTQRIRLAYENCSVSVSTGIYFVEDPDNTDIVVAVDKANIARKNAKAAQNAQENSCMVYMEAMKTELSRAMQITGEAERAIKNKEFVVYYQPKISLRNETVVGAEALVRWKKPDGTLVPPGMFLPYLERSSFIKEVDFYVYDAVCRRLREEIDKKSEIVPISVNVSRVHLLDDDFVDKVKELVEKHRIPPEYLEFELTESVFMDDEQRAVRTLKRLRELGFRVSIDDFGSGYSSLNLLKTLPVDILKLDRSFFGGNDLIKNNAIVVSSIIDMANQMDINVICEGVETAEQVSFLKDTECGMVQGFYYAKPVSEQEFEDFVEQYNNRDNY